MIIVVDKIDCVGCEECLQVCSATAIVMSKEKAEIIQQKCNLCERCILICPVKAIKTVSTHCSR
ncbi:MAG: 4Fe-4S binding protein [Candidatus Jettenia sp. CY-1]|nr:MAG: 4Fe-4S binding protein [Candidatus Jettenia sp. CY-1]